MNKGKYSGEVYLELTFWSNVSTSHLKIAALLTPSQEPPPVKKSTSKPKVKKQYGGPGSFVPSDASGSAPSTPPGSVTPPPRDPYASISNGLYSMSSGSLPESGSESVPSSLRASSSIVRRDLYTAPYETARSQRSYHSVDSLTNEFAELGVQNDPTRSAAYLVRDIYFANAFVLKLLHIGIASLQQLHIPGKYKFISLYALLMCLSSLHLPSNILNTPL